MSHSADQEHHNSLCELCSQVLLESQAFEILRRDGLSFSISFEDVSSGFAQGCEMCRLIRCRSVRVPSFLQDERRKDNILLRPTPGLKFFRNETLDKELRLLASNGPALWHSLSALALAGRFYDEMVSIFDGTRTKAHTIADDPAAEFLHL